LHDLADLRAQLAAEKERAGRFAAEWQAASARSGNNLIRAERAEQRVKELEAENGRLRTAASALIEAVKCEPHEPDGSRTLINGRPWVVWVKLNCTDLLFEALDAALQPPATASATAEAKWRRDGLVPAGEFYRQLFSQPTAEKRPVSQLVIYNSGPNTAPRKQTHGDIKYMRLVLEFDDGTGGELYRGPKYNPAPSRPAPSPCSKCGGSKWLWPHELDEYEPTPGFEMCHDDTRYGCDRCNGTGHEPGEE
jgi:hypothetical protein